jgi:hypothetical protein
LPGLQPLGNLKMDGQLDPILLRGTPQSEAVAAPQMVDSAIRNLEPHLPFPKTLRNRRAQSGDVFG